MNNDKMPLFEIRRILERGEWWNNVRDVSTDELRPWLDELNGAIDAALDRLTEVETDEKKGRLVILPFAVGDWAYRIGFNHQSRKPEILCEKVIGVGISDLSGIEFISRRNGEDNSFRKTDIGNRVFLTHAEAEAALKAMEAKA